MAIYYSLAWLYHILLAHEDEIKGREEIGDYYFFFYISLICCNEHVSLLILRI